MEIHRYYVRRRESVYNLIAAIGIALLYLLIYSIGSWMIPRNQPVAEIIIYFSSFFKILGAVLGAFFLWNCFNSRINPKFSVCSHFLIMGYFDARILPWNEINFIRISGDYIRVQSTKDTKQIINKRSIKYVEKKEDLIQRIKEYCDIFQIDFSQG
jgi:hypothetical protein